MAQGDINFITGLATHRAASNASQLNTFNYVAAGKLAEQSKKANVFNSVNAVGWRALLDSKV